MKQALAIMVCAICLATTLASAPTFAQQSADDLFEDARRYDSRGEVSEALIQLKNALRIDNQHIPSLLLFADLQLQSGYLEVAVTTYSDALLLGADANYAVPKIAEIYYLQGRAILIVEELDPQQLSGTARAELLGYRALALADIGRTGESRDALRKALSIDDTARAPGLAQMNEFMTLGKRDEALQLSEILIQRYYNDALVWYLRGTLLNGNGQTDEARSAFDQSIRENPRLLIARMARGELALATDDVSTLVEDAEFLASEYPNDPRGVYLLARARLASGDREGAREHYERAAVLLSQLGEVVVSDSFQLVVIAAETYTVTGAPQLAIDTLEAYQQEHQSNLRTGRMLADLLISEGEGETAVRVLTPLLRANPELRGLRVRMARAQGLSGRYQEALAEWQALQKSGLYSLDIDAAIAENLIRSNEFHEGIVSAEDVLAQEPERNELRFLLAETYIDGGLLERAISNLDILLRDYPDNAEYLAAMGRAQLAARNLDEASDYYRLALERSPQKLELELALVEVDRRTGDFNAASTALQRLQKEYPDSSEVERELARLALATGDSAEAMRWIDRAVTADPGDQKTVELMIDVLIARGEPRAALRTAQQFANRSDGELEARLLHAATMARLGNDTDATVAYKILSREPGLSDEQLYRIAIAQMRLGALSDASAVLFTAIRVAPDIRLYREASIDVLLRMENFDLALEQGSTLTEENPDTAYPHVLVARAHLGLGNYRQAAESFAAALTLEPENRDILIGRQQALRLDGKTSEALALMESWLAAHPNDEWIRYTYAGALLSLQRYEESRDEYQKLLQQLPENPLVHNNLAWVQNKLNDEKALLTARRAYELGPDLSQTNDTLGWILVEQGEPDKGLPYLREAVARRSDKAALRYHLGAALAQLGRDSEAVRQLRTALDLGAEGEQRAAIENLLASLL